MKITLDRILLQPNETVSKTKGGIALPDSLQQKTFTVITTGKGIYNGSKLILPTATDGDTVIISNNGNCGIEIVIDGEKYRLINSSDILVVL
jgi:co-chaperonin GroES (HSP10)